MSEPTGGIQLDHAMSSDDDETDVAVTAVHVSQTRNSWLGLAAAPLGILALALLLYLYYRSLNLDSGVNFQQASALDWDTKLWPQTVDMFKIAFSSTVLVIAIAVPLGILLTRPSMRRFAPSVLGVANAGQALPAYGLLVLFLLLLGQGLTTVIWALVLYALLPVLRNTMVGLDNVDRSVIEAGRGMGMTKRNALTRIELPLAVPVIIAGIRTAMTINIGMATLAFLIGGVISLLLLLTKRKGRKDAIPFGPPLIVGAWVALVWGQQLVDWYLS